MEIIDLEKLSGLYDYGRITKAFDNKPFNLKIVDMHSTVYTILKVNHSDEYKKHPTVAIEKLNAEEEEFEISMKDLYERQNIFIFEDNRIKIYEPYVLEEGKDLRLKLWKRFDKKFEDVEYLKLEDYLYILKKYFKEEDKKIKAIEYIYKTEKEIVDYLEEKVLDDIKHKGTEGYDTSNSSVNFKNKIKCFNYNKLIKNSFYRKDLLFESFSFNMADNILNLIIKEGYGETPISNYYYLFYYFYEKGLYIKEFINYNKLDEEDFFIINEIIKSYYLSCKIIKNVDDDGYDEIFEEVGLIVDKYLVSKKRNLIKEATLKNNINILEIFRNNINLSSTPSIDFSLFKSNGLSIVDNRGYIFEILELAAEEKVNIFCYNSFDDRVIFDNKSTNYELLIEGQVQNLKQMQILKIINNINNIDNNFMSSLASKDLFASFIKSDNKFLNNYNYFKFIQNLSFTKEDLDEEITEKEFKKMFENYKEFLRDKFMYSLDYPDNLNSFILNKKKSEVRQDIEENISILEKVMKIGEIKKTYQVINIFNFLENLCCGLEEIIKDKGMFNFDFIYLTSRYFYSTYNLYKTINLHKKNTKISMYDLLGNFVNVSGVVKSYKVPEDDLAILYLKANVNILSVLKNSETINKVIEEAYFRKNDKEFKFNYIDIDKDNIIDLSEVELKDLYVSINSWVLED